MQPVTTGESKEPLMLCVLAQGDSGFFRALRATTLPLGKDRQMKAKQLALGKGGGMSRAIYALITLITPSYAYGLTYMFETIHTSTFVTYDSSINNLGEIVWYEQFSPSNAQIYSNTRGLITNGSNLNISPQINDLGQIVWQSVPSNLATPGGWEIVLDGTHITSNSTPDTVPRINNIGEVVWDSADGIQSSLVGQVFSGESASPDINNLGEIVFRTSSYPSSQIESTFQGVIGPGGSPRIIDSGEIFWWDDWTIYSSIQGAITTEIVSSLFAVNNNGDVVYQGFDPKAYILRDGISTLISGDYTRAWGMDINDNGVASFTGEVGDGTYGVFTITIVPEPTSLAMFGIAIVGLARRCVSRQPHHAPPARNTNGAPSCQRTPHGHILPRLQRDGT